MEDGVVKSLLRLVINKRLKTRTKPSPVYFWGDDGGGGEECGDYNEMH